MNPTDYNSIREENVRRYGSETKHLKLLSMLYTDRTHFIYELLQNAEDAGAGKIRFKLHSDRLVILHDGAEFSEDDVKGICGVGDTIKADDVTKIGSFGVGFKSVFTYATRPEIQSGSEHFAIESYVRPVIIEKEEIPDEWTTVFTLRFDQQNTSEKAYDEIANRLEKLSARTLLFLEFLQEISWEHDSNEGMFLREIETSKGSNCVTLLGEAGGKPTEYESWLVYSKALSAEENVKPIQIGWRLDDDKKSIIRIKDSCLFVFFPTELETHLGLVLQGPFVTTPARDNIPIDNDWNSWVISQAADLLVDTLRSLRDMRLLDVTVLGCLPIEPRHFEKSSRFYALAQATKKALIEEDLLPSTENSYVAAGNALLGRGADLRALISPSQLTRIYGLDTAHQWLDENITENTTPVLREYLLDELKIIEIAGIDFARRVDDQFFEEQSDQWLTEFYGYLSEQPALWRVNRSPYGPLRERKYIRLEGDSHDAPLKKNGTPRVFLPGTSTAVNCIKSVFASDDRCNQFFRQLGLTHPDEAAVFMETVLPLYSDEGEYDKWEDENIDKEREWNDEQNDRYEQYLENLTEDEEDTWEEQEWIPEDWKPKQVPLETHLSHIESLLSLVENCEPAKTKLLIKSCAERYFLLTDNDETGEFEFRKPAELYLQSDDLELYFAGISGIPFLSKCYGERDVELVKVFNLDTEVFVSRNQPNTQGFVITNSSWGDHKRGVAGFDPNCSVHCLDIALSEPNLDRSLLIWERFVLPLKDQIRGKVQTATKQTYSNATESEQYSDFGQNLINHAWLPDKNGQFKKPSEINAEDLDSRFQNVGLVAASLGIKGAELVSLASTLGVEPSDIEMIKQLKSNPEEYLRVKNFLKSRPVFLVQDPSDPERRRQAIKKRIDKAPIVTREPRKRSIRISASKEQVRHDLAVMYTNDDGELVCQICEDAMPFRKKDGSWYFEAVQLFHNPELELDAITSVALCPVCSAKFKEYVQGTDQQKRLPKLLENSTDNTIQLELDEGSATIRFIGTHLLDLKTAIDM